MNELVQLKELKVYFRARRGFLKSVPVKAVDGVTLAIRRGETVALVGESGSGKTTLGRAILRLVDIAGGSIIFDDADITTFPNSRLKRFRRRAQAVFQDPYSSISPFMSVQEIVEEPLRIHGIDAGENRKDRVLQSIERVKLSPAAEIAEKYPHGLSGGQRQRVCIARAIALEPEFIVADEPVSMVDASNRSEILFLLRELQERLGISFLYITHDMASARHFADRIAVMYLGTVVELGQAGTVIREPLHPYTRGLLASVPEPDPANRRRLRQVIAGEPPDASRVPSGCPFHTRCDRVVGEICKTVRPLLQEAAPARFVACHLYGERSGGEAGSNSAVST